MKNLRRKLRKPRLNAGSQVSVIRGLMRSMANYVVVSINKLQNSINTRYNTEAVVTNNTVGAKNQTYVYRREHIADIFKKVGISESKVSVAVRFATSHPVTAEQLVKTLNVDYKLDFSAEDLILTATGDTAYKVEAHPESLAYIGEDTLVLVPTGNGSSTTVPTNPVPEQPNPITPEPPTPPSGNGGTTTQPDNGAGTTTPPNQPSEQPTEVVTDTAIVLFQPGIHSLYVDGEQVNLGTFENHIDVLTRHGISAAINDGKFILINRIERNRSVRIESFADNGNSYQPIEQENTSVAINGKNVSFKLAVGKTTPTEPKPDVPDTPTTGEPTTEPSVPVDNSPKLYRFTVLNEDGEILTQKELTTLTSASELELEPHLEPHGVDVFLNDDVSGVRIDGGPSSPLASGITKRTLIFENMKNQEGLEKVDEVYTNTSLRSVRADDYRKITWNIYFAPKRLSYEVKVSDDVHGLREHIADTLEEIRDTIWGWGITLTKLDNGNWRGYSRETFSQTLMIKYLDEDYNVQPDAFEIIFEPKKSVAIVFQPRPQPDEIPPIPVEPVTNRYRIRLEDSRGEVLRTVDVANLDSSSYDSIDAILNGEELEVNRSVGNNEFSVTYARPVNYKDGSRTVRLMVLDKETGETSMHFLNQFSEDAIYNVNDQVNNSFIWVFEFPFFDPENPSGDPRPLPDPPPMPVPPPESPSIHDVEPTAYALFINGSKIVESGSYTDEVVLNALRERQFDVVLDSVAGQYLTITNNSYHEQVVEFTSVNNSGNSITDANSNTYMVDRAYQTTFGVRLRPGSEPSIDPSIPVSGEPSIPPVHGDGEDPDSQTYQYISVADSTIMFARDGSNTNDVENELVNYDIYINASGLLYAGNSYQYVRVSDNSTDNRIPEDKSTAVEVVEIPRGRDGNTFAEGFYKLVSNLSVG